MMRRHFFEQNKLEYKKVLGCSLGNLCAQETDWTCSVACIRTMLSGIGNEIPSESDIVNEYSMQPGPYYSRDIKRIGILEQYDVIYGCDLEKKSFDAVLEYMDAGYYIMLECMYNYAHWVVLLGYYPIADDIEKSQLSIYDPYYNQVRLFCVDEFLTMWIDGNYAETNVEKDFIAIKGVCK